MDVLAGFDIRTLAFTNLLLSVLLGLGSLVFARLHNTFSSFRQLGSGYFLFALGFVLIGFRNNIPDYLSIVLANTFIVSGFSILIIGVLSFLEYSTKPCKRVTLALILVILASFSYFTYITPNINARIIVISLVIAAQCFFIGYRIMSHKERLYRVFIRFLGYAFLFCGAVFTLRIYQTFYESQIHNFLEAGAIHSLALIAQQLVVITSCFTLSWSASQKLATELAIQATIDPLTQLYNRRAMENYARIEMLRAQREKTSTSIIIMDIDFFKLVNDNYGHQIGDKVLQEFSLRLKSSLRKYDILSRYGGEEFLLLLPDTNSETAMIIAEKLRHTIAQPVFDIETQLQLSVTASFGVATVKDGLTNWEQAISFADNALYRAKENGRNQVQLHTADVHTLKSQELPN